jgi:parallel beta-helix repeat protein
MNRHSLNANARSGAAGRTILLLGTAWLLSAPTAGAATTRTVNCESDPGTLPTIAAAIAASSPGDTVKVCPGVYPENVVVNVPSLTLTAQPALGAKIIPGNAAAPGINLTASGDVIQGFEITEFDTGIYVGAPAGNEKIVGNRISDDGDGISFHDSLNNAVAGNLIFDNERNGVLDFLSAPAGLGQGNVYEKNSIAFNGANGIFVNTLPSISGRPTTPPAGVVRARIADNLLDNNFADGVLLTGSAFVRVVRNEVSFNGQDGVELIGSDLNRIACNRANWNGASIASCGGSGGAGNCTGIRVHSESTGNSLAANSAFDNITWDAQDNSAGPGTAGTANTWQENRCAKDSPDGICVNHAVDLLGCKGE